MMSFKEKIEHKYGMQALLNAVPYLTWAYHDQTNDYVEFSTIESLQLDFWEVVGSGVGENFLQEKYELEAQMAYKEQEEMFSAADLESEEVQSELEEVRQSLSSRYFRGWEETLRYLEMTEQEVEADPLKRLAWISSHNCSNLLSIALLESVAESNDPNKEIVLGDTLLMAADCGLVNEVEHILQRNRNLSLFSRKPSNSTSCTGYTAAHYAAERGDAAVLRVCIRYTESLEQLLRSLVFSRRYLDMGGRASLLHIAAPSHPCVAQLLAAASALPDLIAFSFDKEIFEQTPAEIAVYAIAKRVDKKVTEDELLGLRELYAQASPSFFPTLSAVQELFEDSELEEAENCRELLVILGRIQVD